MPFNADGFERDLAMEAKKRLLQLDRLLQMVRHHEEQANKINHRLHEATVRHVQDITSSGIDFQAVPQPEDTKLTSAEAEILNSATFEMELFAECFYYMSGRLRTLLKHNPIPGLKSFECEGASSTVTDSP